MPTKPMILHRGEVAAAFLAITVAFVVGLWLTVHFNHQQTARNRARIADIQESRVTSCRETYRAFRDVFDPFFPRHARGEMARRIARFHRIVREKVAGCDRQVRP